MAGSDKTRTRIPGSASQEQFFGIKCGRGRGVTESWVAPYTLKKCLIETVNGNESDPRGQEWDGRTVTDSHGLAYINWIATGS